MKKHPYSKPAICFDPGECDGDCKQLTEVDINNILLMINHEKMNVDKSYFDDETKIHSILYLESLASKFKNE